MSRNETLGFNWSAMVAKNASHSQKSRKFYVESSLVLSENLNKHFQFPLEIRVYGKALLQRHLAITCTSLREHHIYF